MKAKWQYILQKVLLFLISRIFYTLPTKHRRIIDFMYPFKDKHF